MYDVVVIGAGPGGYTCAIRAAQLGAKVCIIEKNGMGGTCTQRGCISTKYLHSIGETLRRTTAAKGNGINATIQFDYNLLRSRMKSTISKLASGIEMLLKSNNIAIASGEAHIVSSNEVAVSNRSSLIETRNIVIASGSHPICLDGHPYKDKIVSTTSVFELQTLPKSIIVVGGGYSGCEFASIFNALGSKVYLVEAEKKLLPNLPDEVGSTIGKYMRIDGIDVMTNSRLERITDKGAIVNAEEIEASNLLVCIGRKPNINEDELNRIGVSFNAKGITVNDKMQTNVDNVYALGDVTGMYELAHVASEQGQVAAENIMGIESSIDYNSVPACVFTYPEVAFVGQLSGRRIGSFPLAASAKANCMGMSRGVVKVFEEGGIIVGVLIIAPHAGEMIAEATLAVRLKLKIEDVCGTVHAHPTLPESLLEAAMDLNNEAIHLPSRRKKSNAL